MRITRTTLSQPVQKTQESLTGIKKQAEGTTPMGTIQTERGSKQKLKSYVDPCFAPVFVLTGYTMNKWLVWEPFWQQKSNLVATRSCLATPAANKALKICGSQIANQPD